MSLIADARSAAVTFRMPDGSEQTVTYTPENIGQSLPAASRAGYRFDGWKFPGIDGTYKTLTDELLTALNGKTLTAAAPFTVMGGGGGGGGFVSAGYAVSIRVLPLSALAFFIVFMLFTKFCKPTHKLK